MEAEARKPLFISRIRVERLFGQFTYDLGSDETDLSKLLILYGDNGSGKTTILNCIFHLLSPATNRGHRTALGRIPFQRFLVTLGSDTTVTAEKVPDALVGTFDMALVSPAIGELRRRFEFDAALKLAPAGRRAPQSGVLTALKDLGLKLHLLSDDRKIVTDLLASGESGGEADEPHRHFQAICDYLATPGLIDTATNQLRHSLLAGRSTASSLDQAIGRAVEGIRKQAITGSGAGEVNANTLYTEIVNRIASPVHTPTVEHKPHLDELISDLREQAERSASFSKFGLSTELPADDLIAALRSPAAAQHSQLLQQILRPFIDGYKLRLNALEALYDTIRTIVDIVNSFYKGKTISFHLREGITIHSASGQILNPHLLSSGEKQLLLLLCNILAAGDEASVFIIDEPELSLNVKWQRKLVDALLDCTKNAQTQFVLATHSIELLTQHDSNVLKLEEARVH